MSSISSLINSVFTIVHVTELEFLLSDDGNIANLH